MGGTDTEGKTQTYRLTGTALDAVLVEAATLEGEGRTEITAESEVREGDQVTTPNPYQDGQIRRGGGQNCRDRGRLA